MRAPTRWKEARNPSWPPRTPCPKVSCDRGCLQAANKVNDWLHDHEDVFSCGHSTDDSSCCSIGVATPHGSAVQGLRDLIATLGAESGTFQLENVERSLTQLHEVQMAIIRDLASDVSQGSNGSATKSGASGHQRPVPRSRHVHESVLSGTGRFRRIRPGTAACCRLGRVV